jgi:hypothetical protein
MLLMPLEVMVRGGARGKGRSPRVEDGQERAKAAVGSIAPRSARLLIPSLA